MGLIGKVIGLFKKQKMGVIGKDKEDIRDHIHDKPINNSMLASGNDVYTLRPYLYGVKNQGSVNACTGYAIAYAVQILWGKAYSKLSERTQKCIDPFNPLYVYYYARKEGGLENGDNGAYVRDSMKALKNYGIPYYRDNKVSSVYKEPTQNIKTFKIGEYLRIPDTYECVDRMCYVLEREKLPIIASIKLIREGTNATTGMITLPQKGTLNGYHAICIIGTRYIEGELCFEFVNSWGGFWGDNGFGYFKASDVNKGILNDIWTFDQLLW